MAFRTFDIDKTEEITSLLIYVFKQNGLLYAYYFSHSMHIRPIT